MLQVWARFVKFGEIHSKPSPKIPSKIRQPLGALSGHLTKLQPQKNLSHSQIFLSNTCSAWSLSNSVSSEIQSSGCCCFLQKQTSISPVPPHRLAPRPRPLVPAPHERLAPCGRRRRAAGGAPPRDRRQRRLCGRQREARRRRRHPAPPKPPEIAAWPSTPQNALPLSS